ncbi:MAG: hypothetical protein C0518_08505 [Opitutus sp.]|nr:hypothetical protein [Opitutus sp.]
MKNFLLSLCCLGALLVAGCSNTSAGMAGLAIELQSVERQSDGSAVATVRLVNPNTVSYNVASATHQIYLGDRAVGTLEITKPMGLPSQTVGLHTGALKLEKSATLSGGSTSYRLESRLVLVLWGDRNETSKLSARGTVEVK